MSNGMNNYKMSQSQLPQNVTLSALNSMCAAVSCWDGCPTWCWWQKTACIPSYPWTTSPCRRMQGEYPQQHPTWMGKQPPSLCGLSMELWGSGYYAPLTSMSTSETLTRYKCSTSVRCCDYLILFSFKSPFLCSGLTKIHSDCNLTSPLHWRLSKVSFIQKCSERYFYHSVAQYINLLFCSRSTLGLGYTTVESSCVIMSIPSGCPVQTPGSTQWRIVFYTLVFRSALQE